MTELNYILECFKMFSQLNFPAHSVLATSLLLLVLLLYSEKPFSLHPLPGQAFSSFSASLGAIVSREGCH